MNRLRLRTATRKDARGILRLIAQLDRHHVSILPDVFQSHDEPVRPAHFVDEIVTSEDADFILAELDGKVVGCLSIRRDARPSYPIYRPHEFAHVKSLAVDESFRGQGVGTALMAEARRWARRRRLRCIHLGFWVANDAALSFYRKLGFKPMSVNMELKLTEEKRRPPMK